MTHEISPHAPIGSTGGWVALVGGGPGSSGLITARGLELLGQADVVVVDALAPRDLLEGLGPGTEVIDASKRRGLHVMSQEEIDALLVDLAAAAKGWSVSRAETPTCSGVAERRPPPAVEQVSPSRSSRGSPAPSPCPRRRGSP